MKDMKSVVHYFENIASKGDSERKRTVEATALSMRKILTRLENEVES